MYWWSVYIPALSSPLFPLFHTHARMHTHTHTRTHTHSPLPLSLAHYPLPAAYYYTLTTFSWTQNCWTCHLLLSMNVPHCWCKCNGWYITASVYVDHVSGGWLHRRHDSRSETSHCDYHGQCMPRPAAPRRKQYVYRYDVKLSRAVTLHNH